MHIIACHKHPYFIVHATTNISKDPITNYLCQLHDIDHCSFTDGRPGGLMPCTVAQNEPMELVLKHGN